MIVVASAAVIALVPATALAQHNDRRHHHDRGHGARVHHRTFGHDQGQPGNNQPAGTVVSFTNGVLTIKAGDGNMASGTVTNAKPLEADRTRSETRAVDASAAPTSRAARLTSGP